MLKSHSRSHTLSISHSLTLNMLNKFCFHVYAEKSLSHSLTLSHSHTLSISHSLFIGENTLTLTLSHSLTLNMLNNFCFHGQAQKSLLIGENTLTLTLSHSFTLNMLNNFCFHVLAARFQGLANLHSLIHSL